MNLLKCPMPELLVGELVQYMRWSDDRNEWVSDGVPRIVIDAPVLDGALVLMDCGVLWLPKTLLPRV